MKNLSFRNIIPVVAAIIIFLIVTFIFLNPLLQGEKLRQNDVVMFKGMSKEIVDYRAKTGDEALWTNSMFGGMPAYQISVHYPNNLVQYIDDALRLGLPRPADLMFLYFLGFFVLLLVLKVDKRLAVIGSVAFALSSYFLIILEAGHNTKAHAIAYMAPVLAGVILSYRGKYLWGGILTAFAMALEIEANHPQITYYFGFVLLIYGIFELVKAIKTKVYPHFIKASCISILAVILAVLTNITPLWATYEYGKESTRGKSELTLNDHVKTSGLDRDYITQWSYGVGESFSLLIPNTKGGASGYLGNNPEVLNEVSPALKNNIAQASSYWGDQPGTSGPVYVGAIIVFLFVLGMFVLKGNLKWIMLVATIVSLVLSWGKNFPVVTNFFIDHFPAYNKFRAVSMILVIAELCIPVVAILGLNKIVKNHDLLKNNRKGLYWALGITAGLCIIFYIAPSVFFSFLNTYEQAAFSQFKGTAQWPQYSQFMTELEGVRISIFKADALRSLLFIVASGVILYLYSIAKLGKNIMIIVIGILILLDLGFVDHRYLNASKFEDKYTSQVPFPLTSADKSVLKDKTLDYRVLDIASNTFNSSAASYYHKSIGGYHGAKLKKYQELIEFQIAPEINNFKESLKANPTTPSLAFKNLPVLNMLNTKYVIYNPNQNALINPYAYGAAWLVDDVDWVKNADEEILGLSKVDTRKQVLIDQRYKSVIGDFTTKGVAQGNIKMTSYEPNELKYSFNSPKTEMAVFSEIFYPYGWNAYIDGEIVPHVRADYVLRAMVIPQGQHEIVFKFEPKVYQRGELITLLASLLLFVLLIVGVVKEIKRKKKPIEEKAVE
ncbi:MAG: YfhO family protein [Bacteroidales bacterium]